MAGWQRVSTIVMTRVPTKVTPVHGMGFLGLTLLASLLLAGCSRAAESKQYEVKGQILGIKPERQEVLVKHEDIPGFMPAMTMPYTVNDAGCSMARRRAT
ncbi:MAG: copper-binding protein [Acidobacteria bacterium]|nr:copper-binding protein [Acidobacteriota bacterium]